VIYMPDVCAYFEVGTVRCEMIVGMRGLRDWRLTVAAAAIGFLILGLAAVLRVAGLSAAANIAVLVSLAPLVTGVTGWASRQDTGAEFVEPTSITVASPVPKGDDIGLYVSGCSSHWR
jgi:hypothetical protein